AASLAGVGADLPEGLYDGMQHKCAPMRSCGRADAADDCFPLLFRRRGRMFRGTLTLSRKGPAGDWPSQMSDPAVPEICHVDAARPPDGRTARFLGTLSGRRTAILAEVLHGLSPADPGPTPKKLAAFLEASPLSIPLPGARAQVRKRAARLAAALFDACDGVLLVASAGEGLPENGMAADLMPYFRFVEGLARRLNVQIIAFAEPGLHDAALACAQSESGFRRISLDGQNVTPKKKPRAASRRKTCERRIAPPERPGDCGRARPDSPDSSESAGPGPHRPPKRRLLLSSLRLTDFCGFRDCRFTELGPVTVFTGPQGTDPAAPLAACALLSLFRHPQNMTLLCRLRGLPDTPEGRARLLGSLFADSGNRPVRVAGTYAGRLEQDARLTVPVGAEIVLERRAQAGWAAPVLDLTFAEDGVARTGLLSLAGERSAAPAGTSPETPGGTSPKISPETPGET
ncbi:MAG: hypothetical protein Q4F72_12235, partial [Desulfovibrionaceae bacterium]|nr:hypothetical protein [Desulfovibrionaceae bacterium]